MMRVNFDKAEAQRFLEANDEFDALHESPFIAGIKDRDDGRKIYPLRGA